jgi:hypothetical protein
MKTRCAFLSVLGFIAMAGAGQASGYTFTTLDFPGAVSTGLTGISGGTVVGSYSDQSGNFHGFITQVPEPASAMLIVVGISALGLLARRRHLDAQTVRRFKY